MRRYGIEDTPIGEPSNPSNLSKGWIQPEALGSKNVVIGDFYPDPLRSEFKKLGKNPRVEFENQIKVHAPEWEDFKVQALLSLMVERGELIENENGELVPVG